MSKVDFALLSLFVVGMFSFPLLQNIAITVMLLGMFICISALFLLIYMLIG